MEVMEKKEGEKTDYLTWRRRREEEMWRLGGRDGVNVMELEAFFLMLSWYLYLFYFRPFELLVALECICS